LADIYSMSSSSVLSNSASISSTPIQTGILTCYQKHPICRMLPLISPYILGIYRHLIIFSLYTGFLRISTVIFHLNNVNGDIRHLTSGDLLMNCHWIYRLLPSRSPRLRSCSHAFVDALGR
jgi:hypothetical protein